jgi:hypothetical protein
VYSRAQLIEDIWDQDMARYDAVRERYHREAEDMRRESEIENDYYEYMWKVQQAGFGEDADEYESMWKRAFQYANSGAVDNLYE